MALAWAARALWPGLAAAIGLAVFLRLTGGGPAALASSAALVAAAAGAGALLGLRRRDLLAAAAELDRRAGLEAALATGLEVSTGRVAGPLAPAALAEAEQAAARLGGAEVGPVPPGGLPRVGLAPLVPVLPRGARYLAVPAAVLAGVVLLPGGTARRGGGEFLLATGASPAGAEAAAARETKEADTRLEGRLLARRAQVTEAIKEYKERKARAGREGDHVRLPAPPRARRRRPRRDDRAGGRGTREADAAGGGNDVGATSEKDPASLGGARPGPVDVEEAAVIRERFPEYEELVRRYFAGPRG